MRLTVIGIAQLVLLGGCAAGRTDLVESGYLSIGHSDSGALAHAPRVYEQEGGLLVVGQLEPSELTRGGHVDVQVMSPDSAVVYDAVVAIRMPDASDPNGPRGSWRGARTRADGRATYSARFPGVPPQGSVVRARFDARERHLNEKW